MTQVTRSKAKSWQHMILAFYNDLIPQEKAGIKNRLLSWNYISVFIKKYFRKDDYSKFAKIFDDYHWGNVWLGDKCGDEYEAMHKYVTKIISRIEVVIDAK